MKDTEEEVNRKKNDTIEPIGDSLIQHGKLSNRVYLMRVSETDDPDQLMSEIDKLVRNNNYTKVFAKVPSNMLPDLIDKQFCMEAMIPDFYYGKTDAFFMSAFHDAERRQPDREAMANFRKLLKDFDPGKVFHPEKEMGIVELKQEHAEEITRVYKLVFKSYPFPIHDPEYIIDTMKTHVRYFGVWDNNRLMGVSSAEMDDNYLNAEMTDFAVDPQYRGGKLASYLLYEMEQQLAETGIKTAYTIARLHSPAMNMTFLKNGYKFSGTLVKNTNIAGKIESMNVFYKPLI